MEAFMISVAKDEWKRARFAASERDSGHTVPYTRWDGVIVDDRADLLEACERDGLVARPKRPRFRGNIGSALAHITLWQHIAALPDARYLILEDNALVRPSTAARLAAVEKAIANDAGGGADFVNLAVLRPLGEPVGTSGVLLRIGSHANPHTKLPNIWLSSYMLTPAGARSLLALFRRERPDVSGASIDWILISLMRRHGMRDAFVVPTACFGHKETKGDTRRQLNT